MQPRRFNISARRLGNIRSLFVRALIAAGAPVEPLRLNAQLSPRWAELTQQLTALNEKQALARFSQWCSLRGIEPEEVSDDTVAQYREALLNRSFVKNGEKHVQNLVRAWNRSADSDFRNGQSLPLTVKTRREVFLLPETDFL